MVRMFWLELFSRRPERTTDSDSGQLASRPVSQLASWPASLTLFAACAASASPFPTRDQNPLLAGFGLPTPMPARIDSSDQWSFAADFNWGSSAIVQANAGESPRESLVVDGETRELRLSAARGFAKRFAFQLQLPYRYTGAGSLDNFIDNWHDFFGLPQGARPSLPVDAIHIRYRRDGATLIDLRSAQSGLADLHAAAGYQWLATQSTSIAAWLDLKLPTGDADKLTGSGAADASLLVAAEHRFSERWSMFGQVGLSYLGKGDLLPDQQRDAVGSALLGVDIRVWRGLGFKLQLDAHTGAFDRTHLDYLGDATLLTIGGDYRFASGWLLDIGVSEDVAVDAAPDVVFVLGVRRRH